MGHVNAWDYSWAAFASAIDEAAEVARKRR